MEKWKFFLPSDLIKVMGGFLHFWVWVKQLFVFCHFDFKNFIINMKINFSQASKQNSNSFKALFTRPTWWRKSREKLLHLAIKTFN